MTVNTDAKRLEEYLNACEDAEALGGGEYAWDLFDFDPPVAVELAIAGGKVAVLAALELLYDEESGGWYPGERVEDVHCLETMINAALNSAPAS